MAATCYVEAHPAQDALTIGRTCQRSNWIGWVLQHSLNRRDGSYMRLRDRMVAAGAKLFTVDFAAYDSDHNPEVRRLLDECYEAWCRS
jgi:hypothetical protein